MKLCDYRMGAGGEAVGRWSGGVVLLLCGHAAVIHFRSSGVLHQKCPIEGASAAANLTEEGAGGHFWTSHWSSLSRMRVLTYGAWRHNVERGQNDESE